MRVGIFVSLVASGGAISHHGRGLLQPRMVSNNMMHGMTTPWQVARSRRARALCAVADAATTVEDIDDDRVSTVCVALLGQCKKIEIREGGVEELDFDGFSKLVDTLKVPCSDSDRRAIFSMIDRDKSNTIDTSEIKEALRSSGAITRMYNQSLRTFGLLLAVTLAFDVGIFAFKGGSAAFDFLTAYVVEDSLSVDNLFVFLLIFRYFKVPPQLVDGCLNYGITGSILLRGVFIFAGLAATKAFSPILLGFSVFLLFSSSQLLSGSDDEDEDDEAELPSIVVDVLDKLPLSNTFEGESLTVQGADGGVLLTQFTATLVAIALSDVIFAVDSIPAVLAVSDDPFVVYTSNIAAVLGLRALYKLLSVAVSDLVYLEPAVAIVLGFVGLKLGAEVLGFEVSSALSLGVIITTLGSGVVLSQRASAGEIDSYSPMPQPFLVPFASAFLDLWKAAGDLKKTKR